MELSVFTYIAKDVKNDEPLYCKEIIFVKCGKKIYIEITCGVDIEDIADGLDMGIMDIVMPFDMLMKHKHLKHLKAYYELSLRANKCSDYANTIYIIEDSLTNAKEAKVAKIGKCSHLFNIKKMKEIRVAHETDIEDIEEFLANYDAKYGCIETDFEDRIAGYTALVDNL
uniref:Uncharacterized protein n=1 Tax=viral metagenome TaxID=1070528 RepID=A0A6C0LMS1_9ZZZZ